MSDLPSEDITRHAPRKPRTDGAIAKAKRRHVSKVGNGSKLLPLTDGRSVTARRFKDLIYDLEQDLGGFDMCSTAQQQLIRRAALLSAECERQEAFWARGEAEFDFELYVISTNSLKRVLTLLGIERRPRPINDSSNNILADYFSRPPPVTAPRRGQSEIIDNEKVDNGS